MIRRLFPALVAAALISCSLMAGCAPGERSEQDEKDGGLIWSGQSACGEYGVFLGINEDEAELLDGYSVVVIEPAEFSADKVGELKAAGKTVYGYINIGAVEKSRPYYGRFHDITLGAYDDWPDERWIDVSSPEWRDFIVDEVGRAYVDKGFDGFFLDNADVYSRYRTDAVFDGLCAVAEGLKRYGVKLVINGGDGFVYECMKRGSANSLFDGVNQETVFTSIDFGKKTYGKQRKDETAYFKEYLSAAKECGLSVYLLEYDADSGLAAEIDDYCRENGFMWYNAGGLELTEPH